MFRYQKLLNSFSNYVKNWTYICIMFMNHEKLNRCIYEKF